MQGSGGAIFIIFGVAMIYLIIRFVYAIVANTEELDGVLEQIDQLSKTENKSEYKERKQKMGKPKVTDDYLFYKKVYKQKNRSFEGVKSPSALWKKVYFATGDYDETKDECIEHYGFYYGVKTHNKICEDDYERVDRDSDYEDRAWGREMSDIIGHDQSW